jgi:hypothetical protein
MPVNYYPNKSVEDLLILLDQVQRRQTSGATITETSAAGIRIVKTVGAGNSRPEVELRRILYSLWLADPNTYANPYAARNRRVRTRYLSS